MSETYTYQNGETATVPTIDIPETNETLFKVNIPSTKEEETNGVGEGMWACTTEESYADWENNKEGTFFVKLLNDSVYYPPLTYGNIIPVTFRKGKRPVAIVEELHHHYGISKKEDVIRFLVPKAEKRL